MFIANKSLLTLKNATTNNYGKAISAQQQLLIVENSPALTVGDKVICGIKEHGLSSITEGGVIGL